MPIFIDGAWIDVSSQHWQHPGGEAILRLYEGKDASDAFFALHSKAACKRMRAFKGAQGAMLKQLPPPEGADGNRMDKGYRELRARLEAEGWFERSLWHDSKQVCAVVILAVLALCLSGSYPVIATVSLTLSLLQGGWMTHDMAHARNTKYCEVLCQFSATMQGLDRGWWNSKHNLHHALTNYIGVDSDIDMKPFIFLCSPPPALDSILRPFQHLYVLLLYATLDVLWRLESFMYVIASNRKYDIFLLLLGNIWLLLFPWYIPVVAIVIGGWMVAAVATLNHECEKMITEHEPSFITNQLKTTCNFVCPDPFTAWLCGGMQYQIEHHLFPTMPTHKYPALSGIVQQFVKEHGGDYRCYGLYEQFKRHLARIKEVARLPASEQSLDIRSKFTSHSHSG